jgi:hypothetical protein
LKPRKKDEEEGKDERIECQRKDLLRNPRYEKESKKDHIKEEKSWKILHGDDDE